MIIGQPRFRKPLFSEYRADVGPRNDNMTPVQQCLHKNVFNETLPGRLRFEIPCIRGRDDGEFS